MVIYDHQLDVLGLSLHGALASPHLEGAKEIHTARLFLNHNNLHAGQTGTHKQDTHTNPASETITHTEHTHTQTHTHMLMPVVFVLEGETQLGAK